VLATEDGAIQPFEGETAIFITPGYRFRAVDILLTNFHLPRSTLFMLVSAFSGLDTMKRAYAHAIAAATGSIPTAMPACCFARGIEARRGIFVSGPRYDTDSRPVAKKRPAGAAGKGSGRKRSDKEAPRLCSAIRRYRQDRSTTVPPRIGTAPVGRSWPSSLENA
jgi:hypothetical protein